MDFKIHITCKALGLQELVARKWQKNIGPKPFENQRFRAGQKTGSYGEKKNLQKPFVFAMFSLSEGLAKEVAEKNNLFFSATPLKNLCKTMVFAQGPRGRKKTT